jgi:homogentisate 1,2-dioxygenase
VCKVERLSDVRLEAATDLPLRHVHLRTAQLPRCGNIVTGRVPLLFNDELTCLRCRPSEMQAELYRNGAADEIIFIQSGKGTVLTNYGQLSYRRGDYVVIPRATAYQFRPHDAAQEDYMILECNSPVRLPRRYFNPDGQLMLGAPYYERDFHGPSKLEPVDDPTPTPILTKDGTRVTRVTMAQHPLDVVGWDGYLYPFTFNAWDFEPLTGTVHLPPPYQQTFECKGFVVCTFAPRHLDHHPEAVKVPYAHSNVQSDEVLFYVDGNFASRRGVEAGSFTLHPGGIPHGPHPGTIRASMKVARTEEMAVMFDTERPLHVTRQALEFDDASYPYSWVE